MLSLKSVGFSTSRLHSVHIVLSDNGCDKCICSLSESSNVISVVSEAQWKSYILKCMKSQKSNVCYRHIGKCLALVFCRTVFVSWWRVYLLASSCLNWCLVEHSPVKTQRHSLVRPSLIRLPSRKNPPRPSEHQHRCLQGCLQCLHFLSVWEIQNSLSSPSPRFSLPSGVCVKCTLPWFFFIQYSVTCLCKFGLEKINLFMRQSVLGTAQWRLLCQCCWSYVITGQEKSPEHKKQESRYAFKLIFLISNVGKLLAQGF